MPGLAHTAKQEPRISVAQAYLRILQQFLVVCAELGGEVFLFRGVFAEQLGRPLEVFPRKDYGARIWSDLLESYSNFLDLPCYQG